MKQEDKDLLLRDLCARLPYGVKVHTNIPEMDYSTEELIERESDKILSIEDIDWLKNNCGEFKPYLRPMSSMTEEEEEEYHNLCISPINHHWNITDWLNAHHFDYRDLILKGLALPAPDGMYN